MKKIVIIAIVLLITASGWAQEAKIAGTAEKLTGARHLGEVFGGGIVYYLYTGNDGKQHGLIVNTEQTKDSLWQRTATITNATSSWDGATNTKLMTDSPAANYVNGLTTGGFKDWHLPSIDELILLWNNRYIVNKALSTVTGATLVSTKSAYWSSTESNNFVAFTLYFYGGNSYYGTKIHTSAVRAVRTF